MYTIRAYITLIVVYPLRHASSVCETLVIYTIISLEYGTTFRFLPNSHLKKLIRFKSSFLSNILNLWLKCTLKYNTIYKTVLNSFTSKRRKKAHWQKYIMNIFEYNNTIYIDIHNVTYSVSNGNIRISIWRIIRCSHLNKQSRTTCTSFTSIWPQLLSSMLRKMFSVDLHTCKKTIWNYFCHWFLHQVIFLHPS